MANITKEGLQTCLAFGMASLAIAEVAELVRDQLHDDSTSHLLVELEAAHRRLCDLFDQGEDSAVHALALSVLVLADRTMATIREDMYRPDE